MSPEKSVEKPASFEEMLRAERASIRPDEDPGQPPANLSALCISGGGIRSATFALGAIQGLAQAGVLSAFDYLSTVSGGGYIGSWLTAWKQRREGLAKILPELGPASTSTGEGEAGPVRHLREYNNYLSPKLGLFSADTWTLVATVTRNMFLNWLVLIPLLMFALMLPRLVLALVKFGEVDIYTQYWHHEFQLPQAALERAFVIAGGLLLAVGVFNALRYLPGIGGENHSSKHFLKGVLAPLSCAAIAFIAMDAWFTGGDTTHGESLLTALNYMEVVECVLGSVLLGWLAWLVYFFIRSEERKKKFAALSERRIRWFLGMLTTLVLTGVITGSGVWLLAAKVFLHFHWALYVTVAGPLLMLSFSLAVVLFVGFAGSALGDDDREWLARAGAWWFLTILAWAGISSLVLLAPQWLRKLHTLARSAFAAAGGAGALFTAVGSLTGKTRATAKENDSTSSLAATLLEAGPKLAAALFVLILLASLSLLTELLLLPLGMAIVRIYPSHILPSDILWMTQHWWDRGKDTVMVNTPVELVVLFALLLLGFGVLMARCININRFSLHAMYRDRLIRAYLGASNGKPKFNEFTGFDENDNLEMSELSPGLNPFHVVNTTLNLVAGKRLSWQQRKAEPFTISALHCGNYRLGYRPAKEYGGEGGISLGTALSLSGAAASPNMGSYSTPVFGFIMTLLNARLGAWLGNPGEAGSSTWKHEGPKSAVNSLVREAFGLTDEKCPYVYLSDGGHFENLALYEMVKRGCRYIVVLDGAADGDLKFGDLGNALRKIRIDTKIDIQFDEGWAQALRNREKRWAVATIGYKAAGKGEDGHLIYVKPLICGNEPPDVVAYQAVHSDFPHESTANQFFNESQTESYRVLGLHTINEMCAGWKASQGFPELVNRVRSQTVKKPEAARAATAG